MDAPTISKQMGVSHKEFFYFLGKAIQGADYEVRDNLVIIPRASGHVEITISEEKLRVLSPIVQLPYTDVEVRFRDVPEADREAFLFRFKWCFQRGGG